MLEEEFEDFDEGFGLVDGAVEWLAAALVENGVVGGLKEDVGEGVSGGDFLLDFSLEIVGGVFRFPEAVDEGEVVDEGSVGAEGLFGGALELVLLDEVPRVGVAALLDEVGEGGAGVALGVVAVEVELGEGGVVGLDRDVRGLQREEAHWASFQFTLSRGDSRSSGGAGGKLLPTTGVSREVAIPCRHDLVESLWIANEWLNEMQ